jgi:hypothetical protein
MRAVVLAVASVIVSGFLSVPAVVHADAPPVNLPVTDDVRAHLLQAGAALTGHPASEYTGLEPGKTYYGYDPRVGAGGDLGSVPRWVWARGSHATRRRLPIATGDT